ncbi:hypothetical protein TruAng_007667 [Truncatella angustata]|nr:hypothetical protein TruAng_007667 [Truncatella angustata]
MELADLEWHPSPPVDEHTARINWTALYSRASHLHNGQQCIALDLVNAGVNHMIHLLEFQDSQHTRWVVSIPKDGSSVQAEVDVMNLLYENKVGIPRVFGCEPSADNPVGVPFILMQFLPGNVAMDAFGGWGSHGGVIPLEFRPDIHSSVAQVQVDVASVRFRKIGIVTRSVQGHYDIGPFPHIGGSFETAASFFEAWAAHAEFPTSSFKYLHQIEDTVSEESA